MMRTHTALRTLALALAFTLVASLAFMAGRILPEEQAYAARLQPPPGNIAAQPLPQPTPSPERPGEQQPTGVSLQAVPTTPGMFYKTLYGVDFEPLSSSNNYAYNQKTGFYSTGIGRHYFDAPLDLPQGAQVREIIMYFRDNGSDYVEFLLFTYIPANDSLTFIQLHQSVGISATFPLSATYSSSPIFTVDNAQYRYAIQVGLPQGITYQALGARVGYTIPTVYVPLALRSGSASW